ncbi:hypothetical protein ACRDU6_09370 [Mycolicibacterium sp. ELW1]|uniref:hypothetical protein n=1 Tax=Mycobacteriaceae TaxID=1762 RepID=UPI0011F06105|nr:hypothetical protein [Mycobacterium sp. ELW1]QEN12869.1 hypothetical protein D3H54_05910 [Mycobacterium sp. ELW1]
MTDRLRETMEGTLGHFWYDLDEVFQLNKSLDGYVKLENNGLFELDTLRTRELESEFRTGRKRLPRPEAVYGMTGSTRSMFFDIAGISRSNVMGQKASTQTINTRASV